MHCEYSALEDNANFFSQVVVKMYTSTSNA